MGAGVAETLVENATPANGAGRMTGGRLERDCRARMGLAFDGEI